MNEDCTKHVINITEYEEKVGMADLSLFCDVYEPLMTGPHVIPDAYAVPEQ